MCFSFSLSFSLSLSLWLETWFIFLSGKEWKKGSVLNVFLSSVGRRKEEEEAEEAEDFLLSFPLFLSLS